MNKKTSFILRIVVINSVQDVRITNNGELQVIV